MFERTRSALKALMGMRQPGGRLYTAAAPTEAGVMVSDDSAMRFATVHACVRVISEDVAALPMHVYRRLENGGKERATEHPLYELLHDRPNPEMSAVAFKEALMVNALLTGNGYAFIEFYRSGQVKALYPMLSSEVTPYRTAAGELRYRAGGEDLRAGEVYHLAGLGFDGLMGMSPIAYARESIGLGMAAERYGEKFFRNGTHIGGVISVKDELSEDQFQRLKTQFSGMFRGLQNAHGVPLLEGGATYTQLGIPPEDAQFLETRKYQRSEIAAIYRVPPHMIGDLERATFSNIEQQDLAYLQRTLLPWLMRTEQEGRAKLLLGDDKQKYSIENDTANFMRGETATRMQSYSTAIMAGIMAPNEARRRENLNPVPGGDDIMLPLNMMQVGQKLPAGMDAEETAPDKRALRFRHFIPGGERRAASGTSIAAQLEWLGVSRNLFDQLENGFHEWLSRQADDIQKILDEIYGERAMPGTQELRAVRQGDKNRLLRSINDYYEQLAKDGAKDLADAIEAGEFPGWRDVNDALEKTARSTWQQMAKELKEETPSEEWYRGFLQRYQSDMSERLCKANLSALEKTLSKDGLDDAEAFRQLGDMLAQWRKKETGRWRCGNMARTEIAMMRNEAMIAAYRQAGYSSVWRSAPGCCLICTRMNGRTITTLKPPLHKGCVCSVACGERFLFTDSINDGIIKGDWDLANFVSVTSAERHKKHLQEYGDITFEEYVKGARKLLNMPLSDDVEEFVNESGATYRYQRSTNDFVLARDGNIILTRFRPADGEAYWKGEKDREQT